MIMCAVILENGIQYARAKASNGFDVYSR